MVLTCLLPTCLYLKAVESITLWKAISITRPTQADLYIAFGLICCVLFSTLVFFYSKLSLLPDSFQTFKQWAWETSNDILNSYDANFIKGGVYLFIQLINQVIIAPFFEEFFFRGLLFYMLFQQVEHRWALLISALLFSLYHLNLYYLIGYCGLGLVFGYLYYVKQNIALAIFAHGCYNILANIVNYCAYKGYADIFHWIAHLTILEAIGIEGICILLIHKLCKVLANR
ncbi:CPBP family intramembrane glutamic endopeptidase [Cardinium endosymbiont of Nabis limbatus]|uniref:CPBP family intramembrane glutamic endopeptidase n=1 Tax=Cardinium endosymbiont of Nabis limbatus TaxID=3066217 RepID=UPI003AF3B989